MHLLIDSDRAMHPTNPQTTAIDIDIEVYRAIETRRRSFDQSPNDILRETLGLSAAAQPSPTPEYTRPTRRTGAFAFELMGERFEAGSLKEAYIACLRELSARDPEFLDRLAQRRTRTRRVVARRGDDLYLRSPQLAGKFATRLVDGWWVDTNLSRIQCEQRLQIACDVAGLVFGKDLTLAFPA